MSTEARKRRRKRNQYRNKLTAKTAEMQGIIARTTFLMLTKGQQNHYETAGLERQKQAVARKIAKLEGILTSLSTEPKITVKENTS